jgi:GTP-binding protein Era
MSYKAGFVALLGAPNAGKSTLTNCLVGEKISIVTNKPQTTRKRINGIVTNEEFQAILVDAPGFIENDQGLNHFLQAELQDVLRNCDCILALLNLDSKEIEPLEQIIELAQKSGKKWAALITKTDLGHGNRVGTLTTKLEILNIPFKEISAFTDPEAAREAAFGLLKVMLPDSPAKLYDEEMITTENIREICCEIVREKCFENLFEEIPYQMAVQIRNFEEGQTLTKIFADIIVEKDNQRKIVVGQGAQTVKKIGIASRTDIEKIIGHKVYLELHVKIKKKWFKDPRALKELGYVIQT